MSSFVTPALPLLLQVCTGALQLGRGRANKPWTNVEAAMAQRLNHPAVVRTFKHTAVLMQVSCCLAAQIMQSHDCNTQRPFMPRHAAVITCASPVAVWPLQEPMMLHTDIVG